MELFQKISDEMDQRNIQNLPSNWKQSNTILGEICRAIRLKNVKKNRLRIYVTYQRYIGCHRVDRTRDSTDASNQDVKGDIIKPEKPYKSESFCSPEEDKQSINSVSSKIASKIECSDDISENENENTFQEANDWDEKGNQQSPTPSTGGWSSQDEEDTEHCMNRSCKNRDVKKENDKKSFTFDHKISKTTENSSENENENTFQEANDWDEKGDQQSPTPSTGGWSSQDEEDTDHCMNRSCKNRDVKKENDKKSFTFDHKISKTTENSSENENENTFQEANDWEEKGDQQSPTPSTGGWSSQDEEDTEHCMNRSRKNRDVKKENDKKSFTFDHKISKTTENSSTDQEDVQEELGSDISFKETISVKFSNEEKHTEKKEKKICKEVNEKTDNQPYPKSFTFILNRKEWLEIKPSKRRSCPKRRLRGRWTQIFNDKFSLTNDVCVLQFNQNRVKKVKSRKKKAKFFMGKAKCKFQKCCDYTFCIPRDPGVSPDEVKVIVKQTGTFSHEQQTQRRPLKGNERDNMKRVLKDEGVLNTYYTNLQNISETALKGGNLTTCPSKQTLSKISSEMTQTTLLSKDPLTEMNMVKEILRENDTQNRKILGYVHFFSVDPFTVIMFTEDTIRLYREACNSNLPLHLDATGSIVNKIPNQSKRVFYYALVLRKDGCPTIPVAEMITNSNTTVTITLFLGKIKEAANTLFNRAILPVRVEVDFSWAIINSVLLIFNAESIIKYLHKCWEACTQKEERPSFSVVHLCAFHMLGIMKYKFRDLKIHKKLKEFGKFSFALMMMSKTLEEGSHTYTHICRALGNKKRDRECNESIDYLKRLVENLPEKTEEASECVFHMDVEEKTHYDILTEGTIRSRSPFDRHFTKLREKALGDHDNQSFDNDNEYHCPDMLNIIHMYLYLFPLWSALFLENGLTRDTNSLVENWFRQVKQYICKEKHLTPGSFVRKTHTQVVGRCREYSILNQKQQLRDKTTRKRNIDISEEKWSKTPKKKGKYFYSPKVFPKPQKKRKNEENDSTLKKKKKKDSNQVFSEEKDEDIRHSSIEPVDNTSKIDSSQDADIPVFPKLYKGRRRLKCKPVVITESLKPKCDRTQTLEDTKCQQFQTPKKKGNKYTCDGNATPFEPSVRNNEDSNISIDNECIAPSSVKDPTFYDIGDLSLPELKLSKRSRRKRFLPQKLFDENAYPNEALVNQPYLYQKPLSRHGILNTRNNCWLNAVLQSFTAFHHLLSSEPCNTGDVLMDTCISKIQFLMSPGPLRSLEVDDILDITSTTGEYLGEGCEQQDPAMITNEIIAHLGRLGKTEQIILHYRHQCFSCKTTSPLRHDTLGLMSAEIPRGRKEISVQNVLEEFFKEEVISKRCSTCQKNTKHRRNTTIANAPRVFGIQLKRFDSNLSKLKIPVQIDRRIHLMRETNIYTLQSIQNNSYILLYEKEYVKEEQTSSKSHEVQPAETNALNCVKDAINLEKSDINEILLMVGQFHLRRRDLQTLVNGQWLTDQIVNASFAKLSTRNIGFMDTFTIPTVRRRNITPVIDTKGKDIIFFPIHLPGHWALWVWDRCNNFLTFLDPMDGEEVFGEIIRKCIGPHAPKKSDKKLQESLPRQTNYGTCGLLVICYAVWLKERGSFKGLKDDRNLKDHILYLLLK